MSKSNIYKTETMSKLYHRPIEDLKFIPSRKSEFRKQCLQRGYYQVQPINEGPSPEYSRMAPKIPAASHQTPVTRERSTCSIVFISFETPLRHNKKTSNRSYYDFLHLCEYHEIYTWPHNLEHTRGEATTMSSMCGCAPAPPL
jgi:hypothetical protein